MTSHDIATCGGGLDFHPLQNILSDQRLEHLHGQRLRRATKFIQVAGTSIRVGDRRYFDGGRLCFFFGA